MNPDDVTVAGIDVGAERRGFHAVALCKGVFKIKASTEASEIAQWCCQQEAKVVAVDAPCGWSQTGKSRLAERDLKIGERKIQCFATPTRATARANKKGFFNWVFNGEKLYKLFKAPYPLFEGGEPQIPACIETFPHAIVCALNGKVVPAKPKGSRRRKALRESGYDDKTLSNIDFVDAALCPLPAHAFLQQGTQHFGQKGEGFIVVPDSGLMTEAERQERLKELSKHFGLTGEEVVRKAEAGELPHEPEFVEWLVLLNRGDLV